MNDEQMLPEENFMNHSFQLYKIGLDQKTLNLIEALLMELSLISNQSQFKDSFTRSNNQSIGLMEGILKYQINQQCRVLEWKIQGNINDGEFSMLYVEWLKSKSYNVKENLISFSYDQLLPKNSMINYLRNQQHPDLTLSLFENKMHEFFMITYDYLNQISQYMELLNSQFNDQLGNIAKISSRQVKIIYLRSKINQFKDIQNQYQQIELSEDIYIMFDEEGIGYIGMDQMIFLYMVLIIKQRFIVPCSKAQFFHEFNNFVSLIPQINGRVSLRSFKTYLIMSSVSIDEINDIFQGCKELLNEFGWNQFNKSESSDEQFVFPKPFNEAFVECMNSLHQQGYVHDDDLMRDEFLNAYNMFLNEEYYKISGALSNNSTHLCYNDQTKIQRNLFNKCLEYYNERVLQGVNIKIQQMVFNAFVIKFDQKILLFINQFLNKYAISPTQNYQSHDSRQEVIQQRGSRVFSQTRVGKSSMDIKDQKQRLEKENYKPKINFIDDNQFNNQQNNYNSWNENNTTNGDQQIRQSAPYFQTSTQQTQPTRNSMRDNSYLDNLQNNINKNIKNGYNNQQMNKGQQQQIQSNSPYVQQYKQQVFQQFTTQNKMNDQRENYPIEYSVRLNDFDNQQSNRHGNQPNKNLRHRSKSPIQLHQIENQNQSVFNNSKISTPKQQKNQFQIISKPPLDGRQNLRYISSGFNIQESSRQNSGISRSRNQNSQSNSQIKQVTPTKSVPPIKFHITLSNSKNQQNNQQKNNNQQKPYINEFQIYNNQQQQQQPQGISLSRQTSSSRAIKMNQGSSVKKAKSFISVRANSIENVNHFNSDIQARQQTSIGYREQSPEKQYYMTNSNWNENSNLKNRKQSYQNNNTMQQSVNSFQNLSTLNNNMQRSKSPQVRKTPTPQMYKRVESFEKVMQRLTSQQGVSPLKEFKKKPFH